MDTLERLYNHCTPASDTEYYLFQILELLFNKISYMDPPTIRHNIEQGCSGGMTEEDRTIDTGIASYLIDHFSVAYFGLIANAQFRDSVKEAVATEVALEKMGADSTARFRKETVYANDRRSGEGYTVDFENYDEGRRRDITSRILASFSRSEKLDNAIDEMARELTDSAMLEIGFIASNFMYLFRAVSRNETFTHYLMTVIDSVEKELGI